MKTFRVTKNEILEALDVANLQNGTFFDPKTGGVESRTCGVCAVGAIYTQVDRIVDYLFDIDKIKLCYAYNSLDPYDGVHGIINDSLTSFIITPDDVDRNSFSYDDSPERMQELDAAISWLLSEGQYLNALSLFFETYYNNHDDTELKRAGVQNFVIQNFPSTISVGLAL